MGKPDGFDPIRAVLEAAGNTKLSDLPPTRLTPKQVREVIDMSASHIERTLVDMGGNDAYYDITCDVFTEMPEQVQQSVDVYRVVGGPGCGKSTIIKKVCDKVQDCTVMVPFKRLKADYVEERCFTQHSCVLKRFNTSFLLVDEFTGCDAGLVLSAAINQNCNKIVLWGDVKQTWLLEAEGVGFRDFKVSTIAILCGNYRNPRLTVELLNRVCGDEMMPMSKIDGLGITVMELYGDEVFEDGANLTFTRESVDELASRYFIPAITVRSSQGATYDVVNLFVFQRDLNMFTNLPLFRVACSRHRVALRIYTCHVLSAKAVIESGHLSNDHLVGLDFHELGNSKGLISRLLAFIGL